MLLWWKVFLWPKARLESEKLVSKLGLGLDKVVKRSSRVDEASVGGMRA